MPAKADIIAQLKKDILPLQGYKPTKNNAVDVGLGSIKHAFPNSSFPLGAVHEFCCTGFEDAAATSGFIGGLVSSLMHQGGVSIWVSTARTIFPPALKLFGIEPDRIIFIDLQKEKDVLWTIEEALKCEGLAAVIGEIKDIDFTASRRLQLAVEQSRVTGFILRKNPRNLMTTASVTRWQIKSLPSKLPGDMPGVGFPRWDVSLMKVRNGRPGNWQLEWTAGRFRHISKMSALPQQEQQKKTG